MNTINHSAEELYELGRCYCQAGHYAEAKSIVREGILAAPADARMHNLYGKILLHDGSRAYEAASFFTNALFLDPGNSDYRQSLAGLGGIVWLPKRSVALMYGNNAETAP